VRMGAKQDKAKDDIESLRSLPLDKQLSMLNGTLNVKNVTAKSMKAALPSLVLFNKSYHPSKDLMMGQPLFNCPSLINTLISKYLTFDGAGDESLKVPALTATIHTLGLLAREDGARYAIIEAEAIPLIVSAMNSHPEQADLLEYSLFALGNLSLHSEGKNAIMNLDGVALISRIMKSHKSSPGVLERACFTLGNLAYHESCKRVILEAGCVEVAVEAAKAHPDASQFLLETCFFFSNMSVIPTGRSLVISLGGLQIVIDAMQRHQSIAELLDLACTAIYNISLDPAGRKLIDEVGALEIVLKSIANNLHAASFLSEAIGSVGRLFLESEQNIVRLIKARASELILQAKARHEEDATVTTTATAVLGQLAECEDVHFQTLPAVPTLKELSGRVILNQPTKNLARLPYDLIEYLQASTQRCDCCGRVWIDTRFELITMENLKGFQRKLPVYHQLCSGDCFAKKKNVPELPAAEPSAEPIVQIHAH
jgi:hypothetical protein